MTGKHRKRSAATKAAKAGKVAVTTGAAAGVLAGGTALLDTPTASAADGGTLGAIEKCESGGQNVKNAHSTASGYFQILDSTWADFDGYPTAQSAPYAVQLAKAETLPLSAWAASESCWAGKSGALTGGTAAPQTTAPKHAAPTTKTPPPSYTPKHSAVTLDADSTPTGSSGGTYTVVQGDSLFRIGVSHGGESWQTLWSKNKSKISNPDLIFPGQVINL